MTTTTIDRALARTLSSEIEAAVASIGESYGVKIATGNGRFSPTNLTLKLNISTIGKDGAVNTKEADDFRRYAMRWGLEKTDLGASFRREGIEYTITGAKPRSKKYPILATRPDGRTFKFGASTISRYLNANA